jgi:hypothetical protein
MARRWCLGTPRQTRTAWGALIRSNPRRASGQGQCNVGKGSRGRCHFCRPAGPVREADGCVPEINVPPWPPADRSGASGSVRNDSARARGDFFAPLVALRSTSAQKRPRSVDARSADPNATVLQEFPARTGFSGEQCRRKRRVGRGAFLLLVLFCFRLLLFAVASQLTLCHFVLALTMGEHSMS